MVNFFVFIGWDRKTKSGHAPSIYRIYVQRHLDHWCVNLIWQLLINISIDHLMGEKLMKFQFSCEPKMWPIFRCDTEISIKYTINKSIFSWNFNLIFLFIYTWIYSIPLYQLLLLYFHPVSSALRYQFLLLCSHLHLHRYLKHFRQFLLL